ncbi:TniB family NTP-binding protein [Echinimonas agarilytica]|uniref:TniB family NTP-binding protein n=1 Tax=Echinimonas agarilytica TaxID=1215918 RepID=A0AA41W7I1_9GAMM|nr:TniB family NTP-binding protein [Echinimonas agarilytica]MCM2679788.1 TniB family NTP-binding protein [Echinimonas agarilytica]
MKNLSPSQLEQLSTFANCYIEYPQITEIYDIFDQLRFQHSLGAEAESFLLTGEAGSGKSALIANYLSRFKTSAGSFAKTPVLSSRVPSKISERNSLVQLCIDLGQNTGFRPTRGRIDIALAKGLVVQLKRKSVELIILNEVQELVEYSSPKQRQEIANAFKYISEEANVSFVLLGMPYAEIIAEEPQWNSRLTWRRELEYFKLIHTLEESGKIEHRIDTEKKRHFAMFVAGLASRMGFEDKPNLTSNDVLYPLFAMSKGEPRALKNFLQYALMLSLQQDAPLDKAILAIAFEQKFKQDKNPFTTSLDDLGLSQIQASSSYNITATNDEDKLLKPRFSDHLSLSTLLSKKPLKA